MKLRSILFLSMLVLGGIAPSVRAGARDPTAVTNVVPEPRAEPRAAAADFDALYAERETVATDLEQFAGGHSGLYILAVVLLVVILVIILV